MRVQCLPSGTVLAEDDNEPQAASLACACGTEIRVLRESEEEDLEEKARKAWVRHRRARDTGG